MAKPVVYIVLYSLYQHVYKLSQSIQQGLEEKGVEVKVFQVAETLSDEILLKMQAPVKPDLPIMTVDKLAEPDGIIFGLPTRFGLFPAQIKTLLDASGALWAKGALAGKFAGTFFSTASQHGGQETTALTAVTYFAHHGMMYVPFGYANVALQNNDEVIGGSAYGAGTISDGDGSRQPSKIELDIAKNQGQNFGVIVSTFVKGRSAIEGTTPNINNKSVDNTADGPTSSSAVGAAGAAGNTGTAGNTDAAGNAMVGNGAPSNATGGIPNETAGNASAAPIENLDGNNGPATPAHDTSHEDNALGNAAPTNAIAGTPATPAGNATRNDTTNATASTTGKNTSSLTAPTGAIATTAAGVGADDAGAAAPQKNLNSDVSPTVATAGNANSKVTNTSNSTASKVGAPAGATAAGATSAPNKLKDSKPKKTKKWFCC